LNALYIAEIYKSKLLHTIKIEVEGLNTAVCDVSVVVHDTAREITTIVNTLPEVSANLTDLRNMLPSVASNVATIMQLTVRIISLFTAEVELAKMCLLANVAKMNQRIPLITPVVENNAKSYYMVPNRRVRAFVGREDILARIETGFSSGSAPRIVVLRGLGGQGKTQVALEYCSRAKSTEVRGIFWVEAASESALRKSFESIAERVKGPDDTLQDADARVAFVLEKLGTSPYAWLMVFDNYDDPVSFNNIQDFMPMGEHGSLLVTSRHAAADSLADEGNAIELPGLDERDALELLFKQSMIRETDTMKGSLSLRGLAIIR
jgi:hypothetical protein